MYKRGKQTTKGGRMEVPKPEETRTTADWARRALGFEADETQRRVLNTASRRVLLNCTRQWGKSTVTAAKAVHAAYTRAESLTLVVSPSARQSAEFLRKAETFARRLKVRPQGDGDNEISLLFPNRSRIVGLPGNEATARGFSAVSLLIVDEASRVSDDLYLAIRPMLAVSGGTLWLMSTPHGKRGFFWEAWDRGSEWDKFRITAEECPRISREHLSEERRTQGDKWYRQEYECEFVDEVSGVFNWGVLEEAIVDDLEPLEI